MELIGDVARKRGNPDALAVEAAKTRCAASLGQHTGLFHVPAVIRFDAVTGTLETERVHGFVRLVDLALRRDPRLLGICRRVGAALARAHAELRIPESLHIPLPGSLAGESAESCVLHGDLNGSNVGYDPSSDRIVILDWSAAPAVGVAATIGSRYFDLLWFTLFFFRFRPGNALFGWEPERWASAFLAGYAAGSGAFSADALRAYHEHARPFLVQDDRAERARRGSGIRAAAHRFWVQRGWRRFEKFLASLSDPPVGPGSAP